MISLSKQVDRYLCLRRVLGFKLHHEGFMLPDFARFVMKRGGQITADIALKWACTDTNASINWWNRRLSMARSFAKFVHARDPRHEIPSDKLLKAPRRPRMTPYIFAKDEIHRLMKGMRQAGGLRGATDATIFGLLAATGMRAGEVLRLDRTDIDWKQGLLTISGTKFGKSRRIPLHASTIRALARYARTRDLLMPSPRCPAFFLSVSGTRVHHQNFHHRYLRILTATGLETKHSPRPRLHDLRHTFIIRTLVDWYRAGHEVQALLASLSTYVGHVNPSSTYWYLTATRDLLGQAVRRLDRAQGRRP